jgi:hypothetical protein
MKLFCNILIACRRVILILACKQNYREPLHEEAIAKGLQCDNMADAVFVTIIRSVVINRKAKWQETKMPTIEDDLSFRRI